MNSTDWLVYTDDCFEVAKGTGGNADLADVLAEYMSIDAPILGIVDKNSPARELINQAGGIVVTWDEIDELPAILRRLADGRVEVSINRAFRAAYSAADAAKTFVAPSKFSNLDDLVEETNRSGDDKLVSICIPAYNVEWCLDRCVASLVACKWLRAFQIIIVNDGSQDKTLTIANGWAEKYPGIIEVIDKSNGGHGSTINAALEVAKGVYFRVIDGDDWVDSDNLDALISNRPLAKV